MTTAAKRRKVRKTAKSPKTVRVVTVKPEEIGQPIDPNKSYTTEQLMRDAQVSSATIGRWRRNGLVPDRIGKRNRYRGVDVLKFLHPEKPEAAEE